MPAVVEGMLFGLLIIFLVGPVFFALMQTSVDRGFMPAAVFAFGVWLTDVALLALVLYGLHEFARREVYGFWFGMTGGAVLIAFGVFSILKAGSSQVSGGSLGAGGIWRDILKGMAFNGLNPMVMVFWSGVVSYEFISFNHSISQRVMFFSGLLLVMITGDLTKAYFASRVRTVLKPKLIFGLNRVVGAVLVFLGARLFYLSLGGSL